VRNEKRMLQEAVDALSTRAPRPRSARHQQPPPQVALRHAQRQAGPLPPEPARQRAWTIPDARSSSSARVELASSAACPRRWRSNSSSPSSTTVGSAGHCTRSSKRRKWSNSRTPSLDILEEVIREHPCCSTRASHATSPRHPGVRTCACGSQADPHPPAGLHRVHADFDGDQMAVHIPLSRRGGKSRLGADAFRNNICPRPTACLLPSPRRTWCRHLLPDQGQPR